jgi:hypothetical protein
MAALGSALKPEIVFPLDWDFFHDPLAASLKEEYATVSYTHYQPVFPRMVLMGGFLFFVLLCGLSGYFWAQNHHMAQAVQQQENLLTTRLSQHAESNSLFVSLMTPHMETLLRQANHSTLHLDATGTFEITGEASGKAAVQQVQQRARVLLPVKPLQVVVKPSGKPALQTVRFVIRGKHTVAPSPKEQD